MKINEKSKRLAYLLRHDTDYNFDSQGWREISDLTKNHNYTLSELKEIVKNDNKGRYEMDLGCTKIRAVQGHSIPGINPNLKSQTPPPFLYHGTSSRFIDSILREGIQKRSRNHVHLSADKETAEKVGIRHGGKTVIIEIDTEKMLNSGIEFFQASNGVWLVDFVDKVFFNDIIWLDL